MAKYNIAPGQRFGRLTAIEPLSGGHWRCQCDCGNESTPTTSSLVRGNSTSCGNCGKNIYRTCEDGVSVEVTVPNGEKFFIDATSVEIAKTYKWYIVADAKGNKTVMSSNRVILARLLMGEPKGYEVDHIDLDRLNNRMANLRLATHQQNQINQPLQRNNTSGVTGVRWYKARSKWVARIKIAQHDVHLGYYETFEQAVQARNVAMECMFGAFARYNDVPPAPPWICEKVINKCKRFAHLSTCEAFVLSAAEPE